MTSDVAVIGGGIIGASIAWRLAQAGAAVRLVEAGEWGREASWAGAGMLSPGGEVECDGPSARLAMDGRSLYSQFVAELTAVSGVAIDYRECGALELAGEENERSALLARMEAQRLLGIESEWLDAAALPQRLEAIARRPWAGAAWYPGDAIVNPRDLMQALRIACERAGVRIHEHTAVAAISCQPSHAELHTAEGARITAETAVLAAGAWASHIKVSGAPALPESFPVRGHLIQFHLPPAALPPILRQGHTYLLQRTSGALVAGTTTEHAGFDRAIDTALVHDIHQRAASLLPELAALQPAEVWNGFRPGAAADEPVIGPVAGTRLFTAYGHYRNGILMAPATARAVAAALSASWGRS